MKLAYIDESYTRGCYWFGAILVPEQADAVLQREILSIPARYAEHGIPVHAELHGHPLWSGAGVWKGLEPRLRIDAMRRTLRTIERADAHVIFVGVDRDRHALDRLDHARTFAVNELLECVERECRTTLAERCLLIFDEETSTSRELFQVVHDRHRQTLLAGDDPRIVERPVIAPRGSSSKRAAGASGRDDETTVALKKVRPGRRASRSPQWRAGPEPVAG